MPDSYKLSIVMITVPERFRDFSRLRKKVQAQIDYCAEIHPTLGAVEIVDVVSEKYLNGGPTIGEKRQQGLNMSQGEYVCWLDDDDNIAPNYVETILRLALNGADVLTFNNISRFEGYWCVVQMNLDFKTDEQVFPGIVHRRPYHVCAWKRELLNGVKFPKSNKDEDVDFITEALKVCKTQSKTEAILHEYRRLTESLAEETYQNFEDHDTR